MGLNVNNLPGFANYSLGLVGANATGTIALNSAFTFGSAGACVGFPIFGLDATTLTDFYFFVTGVSGTAANITINAQLRTRTATVGSIVTNGTGSVSTPVANQWHRITFSTPPANDAHTYYLLCLHNAASVPATDFPTICTTGPATTSNNVAAASPQGNRGVTSTNGFVALTDLSNRNLVYVAKFANGSTFGSVYNTSAADTNNTVWSGLYLPAIGAICDLIGIELGGAAVNNSTFRVYEDGVLPGGTPLASRTLSTYPATSNNMAYVQRVSLDGTKAYRFVVQPPSSSTVPGFAESTDFSRFADVQNSRSFGGFHTTSSAGAWVNTESRFSRMRLFLDNFSMPSGGGIPIGRLISGGV